MIDEKPLRKLDILIGAATAALGGAIIAGALRMPMGGSYGGVANPWYASPAAMPLFIGGALILCAGSVLAHAVKRGGHRGLAPFLGRFWSESALSRATGRGALAWGSLLLYTLALALKPFGFLAYPLDQAAAPALLAEAAGINYTLSSALFLLLFSLAFYRPQGSFPSLARSGALAGGSVVAAVAIAWCFSELLRVPLP